ncbi:hypothetical protein BH09GEM1_BH09GEM1_09500 [soil metagenome]
MARGPRGLSDAFLLELKTGLLAPIRERVKSDQSLCLELRDNRINVYFRGGNLMRVSLESAGYIATFDSNYFGGGVGPELPATLATAADVASWLLAYPFLKDAMDLHLGNYSKNEREFQQLLVRDNNFGGTARASDYYICDIEYANAHGRFDFVGVHWPSTAVDRKKSGGRRLVLGEVKCGDGALDGEAGVRRHVEKVNDYLANPATIEALKAEMVTVFNQKASLGLVECERPLTGFSGEQPMMLLVIVNHDPGKSRLREILTHLPPSPYAELRIASASLFGYGLFDPCVVSVDEALRRFANCI